MDRIQAILDFWFLSEKDAGFGSSRSEWFSKNPEFDSQIRDLFLSDLETATAGHYLNWTEHQKGCLALIILFDQFPRNIFRESTYAFETDGKALEISRHLTARGMFEGLNLVQKQFAILPFEHSENMQDQEHALQLFTDMGNEELIRYAKAHYEIIKRFGRFPHRNLILGRPSTAEEEDFLLQPGSSF